MGLSFHRAFGIGGVLSGLFCSSVAQAQPSDARVIRDLTSPGVLSVKLVGRGTKSWSSTYSQYVWDRSAVVVRKAGIREFPNAKIEVGGFASYSIMGGSYPFRRFFVTYSSYSGIPAPSAKTVLALVNANLAEFFGDYYLRTSVGNVQPIALASNPKWNWHTPNSVSLLLTSGITQKISNTELEKKKIVMEVRLYRDSIKSPWKRFGSSRESEVSLGKTTRSADDIRAMKTLYVVALERSAAAHLRALPAVQIPAFKSDLEMFAFLHKTLREGGAAKTEAVLRRLLAPRYFVEGSTVLLDSIGENLVQDALRKAFKGKSTYAEQYGAQPNIDSYSANRIAFLNADGQHRSGIKLEAAGGTWQNGVKVGQSLKIAEFEIWLNDNPDEIARLRSIPAAMRFALPPGAKSFAEWGGQVAADNKAQQHHDEIEALKWTPFTSTKARLKIAFPGMPKETEGKMNDKYPMWTVEGGTDQVTCRAVAIIYPVKLGRAQAQNTVSSALQSLADNNNATVSDTSDINEGTYGLLATLKKDGAVTQARTFVKDDVLYQLILSGSPATMAAISDRAFFGSFQALK